MRDTATNKFQRTAKELQVFLPRIDPLCIIKIEQHDHLMSNLPAEKLASNIVYPVINFVYTMIGLDRLKIPPKCSS